MEDNRSTIELDLTDEEFMQIARLAHEKDVTFNKMVELMLTYVIDQEKNRLKEESDSSDCG